MVVEDQTIVVFAGNRRFPLGFTVIDQDSTDDPQPPLDLAGFSARFAIARFSTSNGLPLKKNPLVNLKTTDLPALIVIDTPTADGRIVVDLVGSLTENINPGDYYFEVEIVDGSSNSLVVATGTITIKTNVENL